MYLSENLGLEARDREIFFMHASQAVEFQDLYLFWLLLWWGTGDSLYAQSANLYEQLDFCLAEWATGSRVSVKFDDRARVKYYHHRSGWSAFEKNAPLHTAQLQRQTLEKVL